MKRSALLFAALLILAQAGNAKIWRVNNNTGIAADFTDFGSVISNPSVLSGDTVHIEASANGYYSGGTLTKKLVIIGTGYFLMDATPNPKTQANTNSCYMNNGISFGAGSKGSRVSGISAYSLYVDDSLVTIERSYFSYVYVNMSGNIYGDTIRQNFISGGINSYNNNTTKAEQLMIYNNIFTGGTVLNFYSNNINLNNGYFINNSCLSYYSGGPSYFTCTNFTFQNDIISGPSFGAYLSSNVLFNCIADNGAIPATNSNQLNVSFNSVFNGYSSGTGYSSDGRYKLAAGSPATGAGVLNNSVGGLRRIRRPGTLCPFRHASRAQHIHFYGAGAGKQRHTEHQYYS